MSHKLLPLPYSYEALEPHMDAETVNIHYNSHHKTYVQNLNKALEGDEEKKTLDLASLMRVVSTSTTGVRNNGGGHYNHSLYWQNMAPVGTSNTRPFGGLQEKIDQCFGSFDQFKEKFTSACIGQFSNGWGWLTVKIDGSLVVHSTMGHNNPLMAGVSEVVGIPILTCDVWEHAYYLKYKSKRADFVENWWKIVNWDAVVTNYEQYALTGNPVAF
jgi:Fe-Mn family superoxide dismutase